MTTTQTNNLICSNCGRSFSSNLRMRTIPVAPFYKKLHEIPILQALLALGGKASCDACIRAAALRLARDDEVKDRNTSQKIVDDGEIDLTEED